MSEDQEPRVEEVKFKNIGGLWTNKKGTVSIASGRITVGGRPIKVTILPNKKYSEGSKLPEWIIKADVPYDMDMGYASTKEE